MKKYRLIGLIFLMMGWAIPGIFTQNARAADHKDFSAGSRSMCGQLAAQTPIATVSPSIIEAETPEPRVLPPVGGNAGLVFGASVLVLIIIGGVVFSSRRKPKH